MFIFRPVYKEDLPIAYELLKIYNVIFTTHNDYKCPLGFIIVVNKEIRPNELRECKKAFKMVFGRI